MSVAGTKILWLLNKCRIYEASLQEAIQTIVKQLSDDASIVDQTRCISATGAHGLVEAQKDSSFKNILQQFYWNLPDGMPLVWWGRLKGYSQMDRCYGPDFFAGLMQATSSMKVAHFFCGGKQGVAEELKTAAELKWGNNN
ncbi:MAG: glycosyltransferase, partial [Chlamydiae bacterium]|nr:glycosyltransferase [Chlamydiota bacterium]